MESTPSAVRAGRRLVTQTIGAADEEVVDRAILCASELVTNAIRYGQGEDFRIDVEVAGPGVRVAVHDHNPVVPHPRAALPAEEGGRGMHLVDSLATTWGSEATATGKVVWFVLDAPV